MNDADIQVLYGERDDKINMVPNTMDPELSKALFVNAIKNIQEDHR